MNGVFADSFYFIALLNPSDQYHKMVVDASTHLNGRITTTRWVLVEVADALCQPASRNRVINLITNLESDPNVEICSTDALFKAGLELYARRRDKAWSLTDYISFVTMTERGLTNALTGDNHFTQAGFVALLRMTDPS